MGKSKPLTKCISFTEEYEEELKHLNQQGNGSRYVCELIRKDMQGKSEDLEERICRVIERMGGVAVAQGVSDEELAQNARDLLDM